MTPIAAFAGIAAFAIGLAAASAKTVNAPQGDNDRIAATTAGPDKGATAAETAAPSRRGGRTTGSGRPRRAALPSTPYCANRHVQRSDAIPARISAAIGA